MNHVWYDKIRISSDLVPPVHEAMLYFEDQAAEAHKELKVSGFLNRESAELPGLSAFRYGQLQEIEAILKLLTIKYESVRTKIFKRYFEAYNKSLTSRDAERYADADNEVIDFALLINQVALTRNQFLAITKGLEVKHWQLSNLTKLTVAGFDDARIDLDR